MMRGLATASTFIALGLLPGALAVDLLPTEVELGEHEARLLVRSTKGGVRVVTQPPTQAAGVAPGAQAEALSSTPVEIGASFVWRGLEGIVEIVLQRPDASVPVDIVIEDDANVGVWVEWPSAPRAIPPAAPLVGIAVAVLLRRAAA